MPHILYSENYRYVFVLSTGEIANINRKSAFSPVLSAPSSKDLFFSEIEKQRMIKVMSITTGTESVIKYHVTSRTSFFVR